MAIALAAMFGSAPAFANPVVLQAGKSAEQVEGAALFHISAPGEELSYTEAMQRFEGGAFRKDVRPQSDGSFHDWRTWIAIPFASGAENGDPEMRRIIGLGGIFVRPPRVFLSCGSRTASEILATREGSGQPLQARYFTYLRTQSFTLAPGERCLALINAASTDNPNIGIFREGELGGNQVAAILLKGGFTVVLLIIGMILAVVSYLTNRPLGMMMGLTYSLVMLQNEGSLFTTSFVTDPLRARAVWETLTLAGIAAMLNTFLYGFRTELRLSNGPIRYLALAALMTPLVLIAYFSNSTPDLIWSFYLSLILFAVTVALRFDIAKPLRLLAGLILIGSAIAALFVEPYYLGRYLPDLAIEFTRDVIRLLAGAGMLLLLLVDVQRSRRERDDMTTERIAALEAQAETDRRLLQTEREYARAREAAARRKAQLAAASHDIRQPIVGLRAAVGSEAERLSPGLQSRLGEAIDYLEQLTEEYSDREEHVTAAALEKEESYSLDLVTRAVHDMFAGEAMESGIGFTVESVDCSTRIPALVMIRATSNLVANALRHAEADAIRLEIQHDDHCRIAVIDNGKGMDAATLSTVREAGTKSATSSGDGLGLAIVHDLARRYGFEFRITSEPGRGTIATLDLAGS